MVDRTIGRTQNVTNIAKLTGGIQLNATTSTELLPRNPNRIFFQVNNNDGIQAAWIKLQAADVDDDKKGIFLHKAIQSGSEWSMPADNIYTGAISAIADSGNPVVFVTEY